MLAGSPSTDLHREVQMVACALYARGSIYESVAMVRGAKAREPASTFYEELLERLLAGESGAGTPTAELHLEMVDAWIRKGMLVEALALLGGTSLGTIETGQEWANLLGELLAPVPVDAEPTLVEMHRQLLTGGAAVALTLLEDRAKNLPGLPAWALRRLEVLRWMLLDNAESAEPDRAPTGEAPTELAHRIREPLSRRNIRAAAEAAAELRIERPEARDVARVAEALANLVHEIEAQTAKAQEQLRTIPMYGAPAAAMQLRMGNITAAAAVYRRLIEDSPDDVRLRLLLADVEAVLAAMEGRPLAEEIEGESTTVTEVTEPGVPDEVHDSDIPVTAQTLLPEVRPAPEESGMVAVRAEDEGPTIQTPSVDTSAAELEAEGRWAEAEQLYVALSQTNPAHEGYRAAVQRCRRRLHGSGPARAKRDPRVATDVVVRDIVPVK